MSGGAQAAEFNTRLRGKIVGLGGDFVKGYAFRFPNGVEVETSYAMGEVGVKAWNAQHQSILDVKTHSFDDAAMTRMIGWVEEMSQTGVAPKDAK